MRKYGSKDLLSAWMIQTPFSLNDSFQINRIWSDVICKKTEKYKLSSIRGS